MLASGMEKGLKLLGADMISHEGLITETHFLKLELLAKLFLKFSHFFLLPDKSVYYFR